MELLNLKGEIEHFYDFVRESLDYDNIDILFVTGIEKSLIDYIKPGIGGEGDYYNMDTVPQILGHFNLYRETLRKDFKIEFVFILPLFAYKYFIRRAPDFFDWHSGIVEFNTDSEKLERVADRVIAAGDYQKYLSLSDRDRKQQIFELKDLIEEANQTEENKLSLFFELGNILLADRQYEEAIASYDKAVEIQPNLDAAWNNRGFALDELGRNEEAIASYDKAVEIKPNKDEAWYNRGNALKNLGRYEEAIASYDKAVEIKPNKDAAWNNRGIALSELGRNEEAIASYNKAVEIQPNDELYLKNRDRILQLLKEKSQESSDETQ